MSTDAIGQKIADAVMIAAVEILRSKGKVGSVDVDALVAALKVESKVVVESFLADGKALVDSGRSAWLSKLLTVECVDAARRAVESLEVQP